MNKFCRLRRIGPAAIRASFMSILIALLVLCVVYPTTTTLSLTRTPSAEQGLHSSNSHHQKHHDVRMGINKLEGILGAQTKMMIELVPRSHQDTEGNMRVPPSGREHGRSGTQKSHDDQVSGNLASISDDGNQVATDSDTSVLAPGSIVLHYVPGRPFIPRKPEPKNNSPITVKKGLELQPSAELDARTITTSENEVSNKDADSTERHDPVIDCRICYTRRDQNYYKQHPEARLDLQTESDLHIDKTSTPNISGRAAQASGGGWGRHKPKPPANSMAKKDIAELQPRVDHYDDTTTRSDISVRAAHASGESHDSHKAKQKHEHVSDDGWDWPDLPDWDWDFDDYRHWNFTSAGSGTISARETEISEKIHHKSGAKDRALIKDHTTDLEEAQSSIPRHIPCHRCSQICGDEIPVALDEARKSGKGHPTATYNITLDRTSISEREGAVTEASQRSCVPSCACRPFKCGRSRSKRDGEPDAQDTKSTMMKDIMAVIDTQEGQPNGANETQVEIGANTTNGTQADAPKENNTGEAIGALTLYAVIVVVGLSVFLFAVIYLRHLCIVRRRRNSVAARGNRYPYTEISKSPLEDPLARSRYGRARMNRIDEEAAEEDLSTPMTLDGANDGWTRWLLQKRDVRKPPEVSPTLKTHAPRIPTLKLPQATFATVRKANGINTESSMGWDNFRVKRDSSKVKWTSTV